MFTSRPFFTFSTKSKLEWMNEALLINAVYPVIWLPVKCILYSTLNCTSLYIPTHTQ